MSSHHMCLTMLIANRAWPPGTSGSEPPDQVVCRLEELLNYNNYSSMLCNAEMSDICIF